MKSLLIFCSLFFISLNAFGQTELFSRHSFVGNSGDSIQYRQLLSDYKNGAKYPLVIFLHGSGERGNDNEAQLKWGVQNFASDEIMKNHMPIVIAPQCPSGTSWGNYDYNEMRLKDAPTQTMTLLIELIQDAIKNLPVDENRVYITGLSMGGYGVFDIAARHPDIFAAAVPVCGGGDTSKAPTFAHIPMWVFHGAEDSTVPVELSQNMVLALQKAGANPGYTQYPEVGHFSWVAAYDDSMMMQWLFRQHK